jgi:plasmid stabilization system protein ParE
VKPYRFLAEARAEFLEQVEYFDEQELGLGARFIDDVDSAVRTIREYPESGAPVSRDVRKKVLREFPFSLFYVPTAEEVVIVAVAAHRRRPRYWRSRIDRIRR